MFTPSEISQWLSGATQLRTKYNDFVKMRNDLVASKIDEKKYPQLADERKKLIARADDTISKLKGTVEAVDTVYNTVKDYAASIGGAISTAGTVISSGASSAWEWLKKETGFSGLNGLGVLPAL